MKIKHILIISLIISLCGCTSKNEPISKQTTALDTSIEIKIYDSDNEEIINDCFDLINKYELIFSTTNKNSELYRINHSTSNKIRISDDLKTVILKGLDAHKTNEHYDISIEPINLLWDFKSEKKELPKAEDINNNLQYVDSNLIQIKDNYLIRANNKIQISLGSIAKGYIGDQLKTYLKKQKIKSAIINLGGNITCLGDKNGDYFNIAIQKPFSNDYLKTLKIKDKSVVTSGSYERYFKIKDQLYHHILDSKTGYPIDSDITSVTIIDDDATNADLLSTLCFIMGKEKALAYINQLKNVECIIVDQHNKLYYSKNAKKYLK